MTINNINIAIKVFSSPELAILGAAIATTISWVFYLITSMITSKKEFGIKLPYNSIIKSIISSIIMSLVIIYLLSLTNDLTLILGITIVLIGALVYFLCLFIAKGISKEDFGFIKILKEKN